MLDVTLETGHGSVTGQVKGSDTDLPIAGATVQITKDSGLAVFATAVTDSNGMYTTTPLSDGEAYTLIIFPPASSSYRAYQEGFNITGQVTKNISLQAGNVTVSGNVKSGDPIASLDPDHAYRHNQAVENARVDVLLAGTQTVVTSTTTDSNGDYSLAFLPQTFYDLRVQEPSGMAPGSGFATQMDGRQFYMANATKNFTMPNVLPAISGQIIDRETNQPAEGLTVKLCWDVDFTAQIGSSTIVPGLYCDLFSPPVTTDANGQYTVGGPGSVLFMNRRYSVRIQRDGNILFESPITRILQNQTVSETLDTTVPDITIVPSIEANEYGWHNTPFTVTWIVSDPGSPISSQTGCDPVTIDENTEGTILTCLAISEGGGRSAPITINYDETNPTIDSATLAEDTVDFGNHTTISTVAADSLSGLAAGEYYVGTDPGEGNGVHLGISEEGVVNGDIGAELPGGTHTVYVRVRDKAGNWSGTTSTTITVHDATPPSVSHMLSAEPNGDGWHRSPVTITWNVSDSESAISSTTGCDPTTVNDNTPAQGATYTCEATSPGGTTSHPVTIKYDNTAPTLGAPAWSANPLTVGSNTTLTAPASDALSGIDGGEFFIGSDPGQGNGTLAALANDTLSATFGSSLPVGTYSIGIRTRDKAGNWSTVTTETLVIQNSPPQTFSMSPTGDTYVRSGQASHNQGGSQFMQVQSSGSNRGLVKFNQSTIQSTVGSGTVLSAKLRVKITDNANNWGASGRTVDVHRLLSDWVEGNGTESDRGTGSGATWGCAIDTIIENQAKNCSGITEWEMGQPNNPSVHPWAQTASATQTITNNQTGVVEYDVTADVAAFVNGTYSNYGWIIKKTNESQNGSVSFGSRESASAAELVITYQP